MKRILVITIIFSAIFLNGCANKKLDKNWNINNIKNKSPVRLVKDQSLKGSSKTRYFEDWAGKKGKTAFNKKHKKLILNKINASCGYGGQSLRETRIVNHTKNTWEEVWLFNDSKSHREDKISGITIYVIFNTKTNKTDTSFHGKCHTGRGVSFVSTK